MPLVIHTGTANANRLAALTNPDSEETTFSYDSVGNRTGITRANGAYTSYTYNARNWLTAMENNKSDDSTISSFVYQHDDCGNRTRMTESNGDYTTYSYDAIYQLTGQTKKNSGDVTQWQYTYTYDDVGNRLTETDKDSNITTYSYNVANQLTHTVADGARTTYTYDSNGSMTAKEDSNGTTSHSYDYEDRLEVVTYPDSSRTTFAYNGEGKRLSKQDSSGTVKYIYDTVKVVLERDGEDTTVAGYTHEGGGLYYDLISMKRAESSYQYLFDGLGSVSEVLDNNEATQNSYRYEAFGQVESSTGNVSSPYRYVGAYGVHWDSAPGLYFMQARYYAATVGRFITMDPSRGFPLEPQSLHRYTYARNNPAVCIAPGGYGAISCATAIAARALAFERGMIACAHYCHKYLPCVRYPRIVRGPCGRIKIEMDWQCLDRFKTCLLDCIGVAYDPPWAGQFDHGTTVPLEAVPDDCYLFDHWSGDLSGSINPTSIHLDANKNVTANFTGLGPYFLTINGNHGKVKVNGTLRSLPWSGQFDCCTEVNLEAVADNCYEFDHWSGALSGSINPTSIHLDANKNVTANFTGLGPYTLDISGDHGKVKVNGTLRSLPWSGQFDCCTDVPLEAVADDGYEFDHWSGALSGSTNPTSIHMDSDKTVVAHFEREPDQVYISGTVKTWDSGQGVADVTVRIAETGQLTRTDGNGDYSFPVSKNSTYTVSASKKKWENFGASQHTVPVGDTSVTDVDFELAMVLMPPSGGRIYGFVLDAGGNPVANVTVTAGGKNDSTDANGEYAMDLSAGDYTVTPSDGGYNFSPATRGVTVTNRQVTHVDDIVAH